MGAATRHLLGCALGATMVALGAGGSQTTNPHAATGLRGATLSRHIAASPATGRLAFSAGVHPNEDIYVVNVTGSGLRRLTRGGGAEFDPSWSPDGRWIAYRHESGGGDASAEIYVMRADGSRKRNLTRRAGQDYSPAWSPDGRRIAFASVRAGMAPTLWVMNADGSGQRQVSRISGEYPTWSPDGGKLAFDRNTFGRSGWDIWLVSVDGSGAKPLVAWRGDEQGAAWSPDGKLIAFGSDRGVRLGLRRIWLVRPDGSRSRRLTARPGERPAWSRDGAYLVFTGGALVLASRDGSRTISVQLGLSGELAFADWAD
jgi:TolB protein